MRPERPVRAYAAGDRCARYPASGRGRQRVARPGSAALAFALVSSDPAKAVCEDVFAITIPVRVYELDTQGHLNSAVFLQYAEHARWEHLAANGITIDGLHGMGAGPLFLESTIRCLAEVRAADALTVTVAYEFSDAHPKTFVIEQTFCRTDGVQAATLSSRCGLLDLTTRRLVRDPRERLDALSPGFTARH